MPPISCRRSGFTLIELLIVIAIIAILAVAVVLILDPAQLLQQSRDSIRVSDVNTLTSAVSLTGLDSSSLGNSKTIYVSLPDPAIPAGATSTCGGVGLSTSSLPAGWTYQCASLASYRNTNGTGWVPVNFTHSSAGNPLATLPVDPINQSSTGFYYTYTTDGVSAYEFAAKTESQKYASVDSDDGGMWPDLYEKGSDLALLPVDNNNSSAAGGFAYYRKLTASSGMVAPGGSTLFNYPVLFSLPAGTVWSQSASYGGNFQSPNGYDHVYSLSSSCSNPLSYETENYTSSTGALLDWVMIPSFSRAANVIYICYGNSSITTSQTNSAAVWNQNYAGVWHLNGATGANALDSTGDGNTAFPYGSYPVASVGPFGPAMSFNGAGAFENLNPPDIPSSFPITLEAWVYSTNPSAYQYFLEATPYQNTYYWVVHLAFDGAHFYYYNNGVTEAPASIALNTWYHVVYIYNSSTSVQVYLNGASTTISQPSGWNFGPTALGIGGDASGTFGMVSGAESEARIAGKALSPDWIVTDYNSESNNASFWTIGSPLLP